MQFEAGKLSFFIISAASDVLKAAPGLFWEVLEAAGEAHWVK